MKEYLTCSQFKLGDWRCFYTVRPQDKTHKAYKKMLPHKGNTFMPRSTLQPIHSPTPPPSNGPPLWVASHAYDRCFSRVATINCWFTWILFMTLHLIEFGIHKKMSYMCLSIFYHLLVVYFVSGNSEFA